MQVWVFSVIGIRCRMLRFVMAIKWAIAVSFSGSIQKETPT